MAKRKWTLPHQIAYLYFTVGIMGQGQQDARDKRLPVIAKKFSEWPFEGEDNQKILEQAVQTALSDSDMEDSMEPVVQRLESCVTNLKEILSKDNLGAIIDDLLHIVNSASPTEAEIDQINSIAEHFEIETEKSEKPKEDSERATDKKRTLLHEMAYVYFDLATQNAEQSKSEFEAKTSIIAAKLSEWTDEKSTIPELLSETYGEFCHDKNENVTEYRNRLSKCLALIKEHIPEDQQICVIDDLLDIARTGHPHHAEIWMINRLAEWFQISLADKKYELLKRPTCRLNVKGYFSEETIPPYPGQFYFPGTLYDGKFSYMPFPKVVGKETKYKAEDLFRKFTKEEVEKIVRKIEREEKIPYLVFVKEILESKMDLGGQKAPFWFIPFVITGHDTGVMFYFSQDGFWNNRTKPDVLVQSCHSDWITMVDVSWGHHNGFLVDAGQAPYAEVDEDDVTTMQIKFRYEDKKYELDVAELHGKDYGAQLRIIEAIWDIWKAIVEKSKGASSYAFDPSMFKAFNSWQEVDDWASSENDPIDDSREATPNKSQESSGGKLAWSSLYEEDAIPCRDNMLSFIFSPGRLLAMGLLDSTEADFSHTLKEQIIEAATERIKETGMIPVLLLGGEDEYEEEIVLRSSGKSNKKVPIKDIYESLDYPLKRAPFFFTSDFIINSYFETPVVFTQDGIIAMHPEESGKWMLTAWDRWAGSQLVTVDGSPEPSIRIWDESDAITLGSCLDKKGNPSNGASVVVFMQAIIEAFWPVVEENRDSKVMSMPMDKFDLLNEESLKKYVKDVLERAGSLSGAEGSEEEDEIDASPGREELEQELQSADTYNEYSVVAHRIACDLGDMKWAREIFKKALAGLEGSGQLTYVACHIARQDGLNDAMWAREIYKGALVAAESAEDISYVAYYVAAQDGLNDAEWARKIFQRAIDVAGDTNDYETIALRVAYEYGLNDSRWAKKIRNKTLHTRKEESVNRESEDDCADEGTSESKRNKYEQELLAAEGLPLTQSDIAYRIARDLGDSGWSRTIFRKALALSDSFIEYLEIASSIAKRDGLHDEGWSRNVYKHALRKAEDPQEMGRVADDIARKDGLNDAKWAREVFKQALEQSEGAEDLIRIAEHIAERDGLNDAEWAREVFKQVLATADGAGDLTRAATFIARRDGLNDVDWARKAFRQALKAADTAWYMSRVATNIAQKNGLNDAKWAREVFKRALETAEGAEDLIRAAKLIAERDGLNDEKWAREVFKRALEVAEAAEDLISAAEFIARRDGLNDEKWAREVFTRALGAAESAWQMSEVAENIARKDGLNDERWAREIFNSAIDAVVDAGDYLYIASNVEQEDGLNDSAWAEQIRNSVPPAGDEAGEDGDEDENAGNADDASGQNNEADISNESAEPSAVRLGPPTHMTKVNEQYRAKVQEALADEKLTDLERSGLDFFQQKLGLSDEDAMRIFEEVLGELQGKPGGEISEKKKRGRPKKVADASESSVDDADDEGGARKKRMTYAGWDEFEKEQRGKDELKKRWMPIAKRTHEFIQGVLRENDLEYEIRYGDGTFSFYVPKEKAKSRQRKFARFGLVSFTRRHCYLDGLYVTDVKDVPSNAHCDTPNDELPTYSHRFVTMDDFEQAKDIIRTGVLRSYGLLAKGQTTARGGKKPVNAPENKSPDMQRKASNLAAQATLLANQGNWDEAESLFSDAIELDPAYALAYKYRGMARWNQNETSGALADCNKYLELRPEDGEAYRMRGRIKGKMGEHAEAIEDFSKAIEHGENDDNLSVSYGLRGYAQFQLNKYKCAMRDFDKTIELDPENEDAYYMRGRCKMLIDDEVGALADLKKSASLGCDEAKEMLAKLQ